MNWVHWLLVRCMPRPIHLPVPLLWVVLLATACGGPEEIFNESIRKQIAPTSRVVLATAEEIRKEAVLPGSYIVAFKSDLPAGGAGFASYESEYQAHFLPLHDKFLANPEIQDINYITSLDLSKVAAEADPLPFKAPPLQNLFWDEGSLPAKAASISEVKFNSQEEAERVLKEWEQGGLIWYAEPNYMGGLNEASFAEYAETYKTMIAGEGMGGKQAQWLDQINLIQALQSLATKGVTFDNPPLIAVMDSGVDYLHPALTQNVWVNQGINQAGCRNDERGCNTTQSAKGILGVGSVWPVGTSGPGEECGSGHTCRHGTHVSGIIAAQPQSDYAGVCPICQIVPVRIVGKTARGEGSENSIMDSSIIAGFAYISRFKRSGTTAIRVVNASFGKFQRSRTVELLIRQLRGTGNGILVIAAAGNEDTMLRQYPAAFSDVIAVSNVESNSGVKNRTSNFGRWVSVAAPGGGPCGFDGSPGIKSSVPGGNGQCSEGSSMSAPMVSGVAGLLLAADPNMSFGQLRDRIITTADPAIYERDENKPYIPRIRQEQFPIPLLGSGVVNARNAVDAIVPSNRVTRPNTNRVTAACGVVGLDGDKSPSLFMVLLFLLGPVVVFLHFSGVRR